MTKVERPLPEALNADLVAPCGMDCGLCLAYGRRRNPCAGCNGDDSVKPGYCVTCAIKTCGERAGAAFCFDCGRFPCVRVRHIDKRYRTRYGMSMVENLERIREIGVDGFVAEERVRWTCPGCGRVISVHRPECLFCGRSRSA